MTPMSMQTDVRPSAQFVTVVIEAPALRVYGPEYANGWIVKTWGDIHRCPVDEAYTLVASGKASYPDGVEKLKALMYQTPLVERMAALESNLASAELQTVLTMTQQVGQFKKVINMVVKWFKTLWDIKGAIVVIAGLLGTAFWMAQSYGWLQGVPNPFPHSQQTAPVVRNR